jgi:cytochrome c-type biogenesis protein CcmH/NrfG
VNAHDGAFCESCGAKLAGRAFQHSHSSSHHQKPSPKQPEHKISATGTLQPWHYAVGAIALAVAGTFIYLETQRAHAPGRPHPPPMQFPSGQNPATPPSQDVLNAIERLQKTVKENPNDVGSKLLLANALHDAGMREAKYLPHAVDAYKVFLKEKPDDPNARVDLGICYFELGKLDSVRSRDLFSQAISEMEKAVKADPKHQPGAFNLAIVQLYSGNIQESNEWFQKAVALNPESELGKRAKTILEQHSQPM